MHFATNSFQNRLRECLSATNENLKIQLRDAEKNLEVVVREEKEVGTMAKNAEAELSEYHAQTGTMEENLEA